MKLILLIFVLLFSCDKKEPSPPKTLIKKIETVKKDSLRMEKEKLSKPDYEPPRGKYKGKPFSKMVTAEFFTNYGNMVFELYPERAPLAVENFVNLNNAGYYRNNEFFRIEEGFIIQAGDKSNTGYADAGYYFNTEYHPDLSHNRAGILSYANNNTKTNSSQFFITLSSQTQLDKRHPVFGFIYSGHQVLNDIAKVPVDTYNRPEVKVIIRKIVISGLD